MRRSIHPYVGFGGSRGVMIKQVRINNNYINSLNIPNLEIII